MDDIIILKSKKGETNYLKKLKKPNGEDSKTYTLKVSNPSVRVGTNENNNKFIEPTGGPILIEGFKCAGLDNIIKSIDYTIGYGYSITFE